jgi:hypothetical protein
MIAQITTTIVLAALSVSEALLFTKYASHLTINSTTGSIVWTGLDGFGEVINQFYTVWGDLLSSVVGLVYELLVFLLMMSLLKKYYPKNYLFMSFVQLFVPISRFIIIFVLRNNKPVDYNEYMRAYYARRAAYGNNPYGNPYGNNPYNRPNYNQPNYGNNPYTDQRGPNYGQTPTNEQPFADFSTKDSKPNMPFSDFFDENDTPFEPKNTPFEEFKTSPNSTIEDKKDDNE